MYIVVCNTAVPHRLCTRAFDTELEAKQYMAESIYPVRQFARYVNGSTIELDVDRSYFCVE